MQTDYDPPKEPVTYYGKKIYYINPLIAKTVVPTKNEDDCIYEDIENDRDK